MNEYSFDVNGVKKIIEILKKTQGWKPGTLSEKKVDSYYQLNFKIAEGKVIDIF